MNSSSPVDTETLEREKLELEIAALKKPWWQTPAYLAAIFPTVLALASVLVAWSSGLLDAKRSELEARRLKLEVEIDRFENRQEELWQTNAKLHRTNRVLQQREQAIEIERDIAARELRTITADVVKLRVDRDSLHKQHKILQGEVTQARLTATKAPLEPFFAELTKKGDLYGLGSAGVTLIREMRQRPDRGRPWIPHLVNFAGQSSLSEHARAHLYVVLALGTGDQRYRDAALDLVFRKIDGSATERFVSINFALDDYQIREAGGEAAGWVDQDRIRMIEMAVERLEKNPSNDNVVSALLGIAATRAEEFRLYKLDPSLFARLYRVARAAALNRDFWSFQRGSALNVLRVHAPAAALVVASEILADPEEDTATRDDAHRTATMLYGIGRMAGRVDFNQPQSDGSEEWIAWRAQNADLVALWHADLARLVSEPSRLAAAVEPNR